MLRLEGRAVRNASGWEVEVTLSNSAAARKAFLLFKQLLGSRRLQLQRIPKGAGRRGYLVRIPEATGAEMDLLQAAMTQFSDPRLDVPERVCCRRALLRAVLLCRASFSDPGRQNHLEIHLDDQAAPFVAECFNSLNLSVRRMRRRSMHVLYIKDGDTIVDLLQQTGAHHALLQFESVRIAKDVRNSINRVVNCETANVDKTVSAAMEQVEAIRRIDRHMGLNKLAPKLQEVASLRTKYPYASLQELAELTSPSVSRSTVLYRLRRLMKIAQDLPHRPN